MTTNQITEKIIQAAIKVHRHFGSGLYEQVYAVSLALEIEALGLKVAREVPITAEYRGVKIEPAYRLDLLVEDHVIVEVKSIKRLQDIDRKQLLTYLGVAKLNVGLLLNFGESKLIDGVVRIVRDFKEEPALNPQ